ncbi:MAG: hypothetical protein HFG48_03365 [Bacilli bacterium]|nr:hypothetical protein [Bacilli bacterium]
MNKKEKLNLIKEYYEGDYTMYFYDTVKDYAKTLCNDSMNNALALQELIKNLINDIEELTEDE